MFIFETQSWAEIICIFLIMGDLKPKNVIRELKFLLLLFLQPLVQERRCLWENAEAGMHFGKYPIWFPSCLSFRSKAPSW